MDNKNLKIIVYLLFLLSTTIQCQKMKDKVPQFQVSISHTDNKYYMTPLTAEIKTKEGTSAGFPYGSTSGSWASSGKSWTEQYGTPTGFKTIYYSQSECKFFEIDQDFNPKVMNHYLNVMYPTNDSDSEEPVKEFITMQEFRSNKDKYRSSYDLFGLIFGFAPKGMIVVWTEYSFIRYEIGRYQAKEITDPKKIEECTKKYLVFNRIDENSFKGFQKERFIADADCKQWDDYRIRYNWAYKVKSNHQGFRILGVRTQFFNGEQHMDFSPIVNQALNKSRAVPEIIELYWECSKNEQFIGRLFFNWKKLNELLKNSQQEKNKFTFKINDTNNGMEVFLNDKKIEPIMIRIYPNNGVKIFRESYKN